MDNECCVVLIFGFIKGWQIDWGGLLMFFDENQDVSQVFVLWFNVLLIFDGCKIYVVSLVLFFVGVGCFQVMGWLWDDLLAGV